MSVPPSTSIRAVNQTNNSMVDLPSDADFLLRNLRLLNLDVLRDWPKLTVDTFRVQKDVSFTRTERIRAAEWVLYKLFELWNPKECKIKLCAYFPALEPLQSVKLRATLCQWLTLLKAEGALSPECMPRKSLFDECQGVKFEELLLHFSTAVLFKTFNESNELSPVAQRLALKPTLSSTEEQLLGGLICAHLATTQALLAQKRDFKSQIDKEAEIVAQNECSLNEKKRRLEADATLCESKFKQAGIDPRDMKSQLRDGCTTEPQWLSLIISGDQAANRDHALENYFEEIWATTTNDHDLASANETTDVLISSLSERVSAQETRLNGWRDFQKQVSSRNEGLVIARSPGKSPSKSPHKIQARTPAKSPRKHGQGTPVASNSVSRTKSIKTKPPLQQVSRKWVFDDNTDGAGSFDRIKQTFDIEGDRTVPHTSNSRVLSKPEGLDDSLISRAPPSSPSPNKKFSGLSSGHKRVHSDVPASMSVTTDAHRGGSRLVEQSREPDPKSTLQSPSSATHERSEPQKPQTLAERTLQTLQQCQPPQASSHTLSSHRKAASVQVHDQGISTSFGAAQPATPDQSRPGTSNTTSSFEGLSSVSAHGDTSVSDSPSAERQSSFNPVSSLGQAHPVSPLRATAMPTDKATSASTAGVAGTAAMATNRLQRAGNGAQLAQEIVVSEEVDYANVFKTRSKLRHSPPPTPSRPTAETVLQSPFEGGAQKYF